MTTATRPNILFIVVDDCGYADLGCTGQTDYATPALDRLAEEGVRFTQAYANAPLCTNTRVALMTGRYQYRLPIGLVEPLRWSDRETPEMGLPPDHPTLPGLLREAGYRTALIGKWHLGYLPRYGPLKSGYDEFFGIMGGYTGYYTHCGDGGEPDLYESETPIERQGYVTDLLSERAAGFVAAAAAAPQPYFLSLHYTAPHWPWSAPSVEAAARRREIDRAEITEGGSTRIYGEMMQILDAGIGRVVAAVRRTAGRRDTLIVFTSDNGGERFSKIWPFVGRKFDLLEGGLRVPQICWWPGRIPAGAVTDQVCITMDLTATCLAAAGVAAAPATPLDGRDLLPVLTGQMPASERILYWRMGNRQQRAVRRGDRKYLKVAEREFLFDLAYDPRERGNLAHKEPALLDELRGLWEAWNREMLPVPEHLTPPMSNLSEMLW
ncbi:MAG TPA: sulfatase-like hydrolase/transferase [Stellaceae bacterium]|nr:sulfatase-like hydrolase/transferase [Stellaceae bacterium]